MMAMFGSILKIGDFHKMNYFDLGINFLKYSDASLSVFRQLYGINKMKITISRYLPPGLILFSEYTMFRVI